MNEMPGHDPAGIPHDMEAVGFIVFLFGWAVMMVAMMLPAALPLILLYRMTARKRMDPHRTAAGVLALLAGYIAIWTMVGLPIFGYSQVARAGGPAMTVLPGLLLIVGGVYQFTALKQRCHARCSSPLFLLVHEWRPGLTGAARLGVLHGMDCLGCCVGLMLALVALGMMDVAWMLTAAVVIFVEKTLPGGHRIARPLGIALVVGGVVVLGTSVE
jgi:predicted metal-binding membrane protein